MAHVRAFDRAAADQIPLFHTNDVDGARDRVARAFCPHRLTLRSRNQDVDVRHIRVDLDGLSLNAMGYGAEIAIEPGTLGSFFLLQLPLRGGARVHVGRRQLDALPSCGTLISPTVDISMVWSDGCEKLLLQIARDRLRHCFEALIDRPMPAAPLESEPAFPSAGTPSSSIVELIELWRRHLDDGAGLLAQGITGVHMSEALMTALLLHHPHTYSTSLKQPSAAILPRHVRRAEEFMRANLDRRISFAQVAEAAGVSLRALQSGFRQFRGASPSSTLRAMRLEAAHRDLLTGTVPSVTAVAMKWGFPHLGRFAIAYGAAFGSSPSDELRRSRAKVRSAPTPPQSSLPRKHTDLQSPPRSVARLGTSPNSRSTIASSNSPVEGSPVREKATAPAAVSAIRRAALSAAPADWRSCASPATSSPSSSRSNGIATK